MANHLIDAIASRFFLLAIHPYLGPVREDDFGAGSRSFAVSEYVIVYCVDDDDVLILPRRPRPARSGSAFRELDATCGTW